MWQAQSVRHRHFSQTFISGASKAELRQAYALLQEVHMRPGRTEGVVRLLRLQRNLGWNMSFELVCEIAVQIIETANKLHSHAPNLPQEHPKG